jgi:hypothetical protein
MSCTPHRERSVAERYFAIDDLASMIVDSPGYSYADYLHMALTCRALLEPALDCLWSDHDLDFLLQYFPARIMSARGRKRVVRGLHFGLFNECTNHDEQFINTPVADDWNRFLFYAKRILYLTITHSDDSTTESVFKTLSLHRPTLWLFPKLQNITWNIADDTLFPYVKLFLSPNIQGASLHPDGRTSLTNLRDVMRVLTHECPALHTFTLERFDPDDGDDRFMSDADIATLSRDISAFAMSAKSLRALFVENWELKVQPDLIKHAAHMPLLSTLHLRTDALDVLAAPGGDKDNEAIFPSLQNLRAHIQKPQALVTILRKSRSTKLSRFNITSPSLIKSDIFSAICPELVRCSASKLTYLDLSFGSENAVSHFGHDPDPYRLTSNLFEPLMSLSNLRWFSVASPHIEPDDHLLTRIGKAWPGLSNLQLETRLKPVSEIMTQTPLVTMNGVYALFKGCGQLIDIHVPVNVAVELPADTPPLPLFSHRTTPSFDFSWSNITATCVAGMTFALKRTYPGRMTVKGSDPWWNYNPSVSAQIAGINDLLYHQQMHARAAMWQEVNKAANVGVVDTQPFGL